MEGAKETINTFASIAVRGIAGAATVEAIPDLTPDNVAKIGQLLIQLAIGVVTLISLFKKAKQPTVTINKDGNNAE